MGARDWPTQTPAAARNSQTSRKKPSDQGVPAARITVSTAQAEAALARIYAEAKAQAESQGVSNPSLDLILAANGIPPNLADEVGRYQAINDEFVKQANGGTEPTTTAQQTLTTAKLEHAQCEAAKSLDIKINPQFGQMDYSQYQVISAPSVVSRSAGPTPAPSSSPPVLTPAC